jgi:catechol 2,3-dioxygenase
LNAVDRSALSAFYVAAFGMEAADDGDTTRLQISGKTLLALHDAERPRPSGRTAGLFHVALLLPTREGLSGILRHIGENGVQLHGAADHAVSEALYLADPEGNGIELYCDRPRSMWRHTHDDGVLMTTEPLDIQDLLSISEEPAILDSGTRVGHIHLCVAYVPESERFYIDGLGMQLMARYGNSASFVSAGGYHHHIAFNTWSTLGARAAEAGSPGLRHYEVCLPNAAAADDTARSLTRLGAVGKSSEVNTQFADPSGNVLDLAHS